jgi:hypothetical protein
VKARKGDKPNENCRERCRRCPRGRRRNLVRVRRGLHHGQLYDRRQEVVDHRGCRNVSRRGLVGLDKLSRPCGVIFVAENGEGPGVRLRKMVGK